MKIAIVHDLLVKLWWAEKVVEKLLNMYPDADIFTLIYDEKKVSSIFPKDKIKYIPKITQFIYNITKNQRFCLPFMARWVESIDLSKYDIVIASNSAFIHWCITKPETKFIVYYHTPCRYMWDRTNEYKKEIWWNKSFKLIILNYLLKSLRQWDFLASQRHDITLANSNNVSKRLKKYYKINSKVIYPNVDIKNINKKINEKYETYFENYYIIISALTEFKRLDIAIKAFNNMQNKKLLIVWWWNYREKLEKIVKYDNIKFLWKLERNNLIYLLQNSKWLIFCWEEDFWIVPIEANWVWIPVFAYRWWWLVETMTEWITAEFFDDKNWLDFIEKFNIFDKNINNWKYNKDLIIINSQKYSEEIFEEQFRKIVWF